MTKKRPAVPGYQACGVFDPEHPMSEACADLIDAATTHRSQFRITHQMLADRRVVAEAQWTATQAATADPAVATKGTNDRLLYSAPLPKQPEYAQAASLLKRVDAAERTFAGTMLLGLIAAWDTFKGELLRAAFKMRPELLESSSRELLWKDVSHLSDQAAIRGLVIEREIDAMMHMTQREQIGFWRVRLNLDTLNLRELDDLVEIAERRNLAAHAGLRTSDHYLKTCVGSRNEAPAVGEYLVTDWDYFGRACDTVIAAAVKLTQMVWRKIGGKNQLGVADRDLAQVSYVMMIHEDWKLAQNVLQFAADQVKHSSLQHKLVFTVNLAQSWKWRGNQQACESVLSKVDWTAYDPGLQLSNLVLLDQFDEAAEIMDIAGRVGIVHRSAFDHWPVYRAFRQSDQYRRAYRALYQAEPPAVVDPALPIQELVHDA